nr:MAG TPA: hypothetical protein [Caudoviricetes sp.]
MAPTLDILADHLDHDGPATGGKGVQALGILRPTMTHERRGAANGHAQKVAHPHIGFTAKLCQRLTDSGNVIEPAEESDQVGVALLAKRPVRHAGWKVGKGRLIHGWPLWLVWDGCILSPPPQPVNPVCL